MSHTVHVPEGVILGTGSYGHLQMPVSNMTLLSRESERERERERERELEGQREREICTCAHMLTST